MAGTAADSRSSRASASQGAPAEKLPVNALLPDGAPLEIAGLAASLLGDWRLTREISTGERMTGHASFVRRPDAALRYREAGTLLLEERRFAFERRYLYRFDGPQLSIHFDDAGTRLFETVTLAWLDGAWRGTGEHVCAEDCYESSYAFGPGAAFSTMHRVTGPRKAYAISTRYEPAC